MPDPREIQKIIQAAHTGRGLLINCDIGRCIRFPEHAGSRLKIEVDPSPDVSNPATRDFMRQIIEGWTDALERGN
jgi:transcriptional regulatory protein LevR